MIVITGSQISLVSMTYLDRHRHISNATIIPLAQPCSLKSATGRSFNPFKGKTVLSLCFVDTKGKLTKKADIEFHVLQKSSQLESILLGLNFLVPALSEIKFKDMTISLRIDRMFYKIPFINEECAKVYFVATDDFQSGAGMIMC